MYACFACMSMFVKCISFQEAFDGHIYPFINKNNCIKCGKCSKACPIVNKYNYHSSTKSTLFAAWAENIELRNKSASGGIFAALALYIIQKGGYVSGAVLEANAVVHILTNNVRDISRMQGSKYQQGTLSGIFRRINKLLREKKKVLFSGTGCQIAALYNFLGDEFREYLITVDIICGGVFHHDYLCLCSCHS